MTNKNYKRGNRWSKKFEQKLDECKARHLLNGPDNLVDLSFEEHRKRAPHSDGYHKFIYEQVSQIVDKYKDDPERCEEELRKLLKQLGCLIQQNPDILRKP